MKNWVRRLWNAEEGADTAEWIVVVGLIVGAAVVVYANILSPELSAALTRMLHIG